MGAMYTRQNTMELPLYSLLPKDDLDRQTWRENIWLSIQEDNNGKLTDGANGQNSQNVMIQSV